MTWRARLGSSQPSNWAVAYLLPRFGGSDVEQFGTLLLDTKHRVVRTCVLAAGTQNTAVIEPRDVFREAIIPLAIRRRAPTMWR